MFQKAVGNLKLKHYFNRPKTPKDNPVNERFSRALPEELINLGNFNAEPEVFNPRLADWLIEFNFHRPHQSLDCKTPIEITCGKSQLSHRYLSDTGIQALFKFKNF